MANGWDHLYESGAYLEHWDYANPSQELVAFVATVAPPAGAVALDIGCGAGREAIFLARCGFRAIGVDASERALAIARERAEEAGVSVEWRRGDVLALPLDDASVDIASDRGCFHHIAPEHRDRYAAEVARVLRPGARLLIRGAREPFEEAFVPVTEEAIDRHFDRARFARGPVLPVTLISDAGTLEANLVVLTRR